MHRQQGIDRPRAVHERDAALARVGRTRRWVIGGTAALTAGAAALVSAVAPGRSLGAKPVSAHATVTPARSSTPASPAAPQMPPLADPSTLGLGGPAQPPQAAPAPASGQSQAAAPAPSDPSQAQSAPPPVAGDPSQAQPASPPASDPSQTQSQPAPVAPAPPVVSGGS